MMRDVKITTDSYNKIYSAMDIKPVVCIYILVLSMSAVPLEFVSLK